MSMRATKTSLSPDYRYISLETHHEGELATAVAALDAACCELLLLLRHLHLSLPLVPHQA